MSKTRQLPYLSGRKRAWMLCMPLCLMLSGNALADLPDDKTLAAQRKQFLQAEEALKKRHSAEYKALASNLKDYPLYPYLAYQSLKQTIEAHPTQVTLADIETFKKTYPELSLSRNLRKAWLAGMAKKKHWADFVKGYQSDLNDTGLTCQYYDAKYKLTEDPSWLDKGQEIWLSGKKRPTECEALFKTLKQHGKLTPEKIWERIVLLADAKNSEMIPKIIKPLTHADKKIVGYWEKALKDPNLVFDKNWHTHISLTPTAQKNALMTQVILRLAKKEPEKALKWFDEPTNTSTLTDKQKQRIQHDIAMYLAHQRSPLAREYLKHLSNNVLDESLREWRVRLALLDEDYQAVLHEIYQLPEASQKEMSWQYWRARALEMLGKKEDAKGMYQFLSQHRSYYGLLANQRLNTTFKLNHHPLKVSPYDTKHMENDPAIKRAVEFLHLNRPTNARTEWAKGLENKSTNEKIAAAKLAEKWGIPDLAIFSITKTPERDDVVLRFPLAYLDKVQPLAYHYNLDPAWIYAIIRQESAFQPDAVSPVGAKGLMQIMPNTGKSLAKNFDIPYHSENELFKPVTNITLGTAFMKDLRNMMHNNPILATAAYNAGPTRTKKWVPEKPIDPEIWIETIPFKETREYVKNILAYTAIYRQRLSTPSKMSVWMDPISNQSKKTKKADKTTSKQNTKK